MSALPLLEAEERLVAAKVPVMGLKAAVWAEGLEETGVEPELQVGRVEAVVA